MIFLLKKLNIDWTLFSCLDSKLLINHINFFFKKANRYKKEEDKTPTPDKNSILNYLKNIELAN